LAKYLHVIGELPEVKLNGQKGRSVEALNTIRRVSNKETRALEGGFAFLTGGPELSFGN
jgi:hypothetical protein